MKWMILCAALATTIFAFGTAAESQMKDMKDSKDGEQAGHIMVVPDDLEWKAGPPSLPAGAEMAVLEGDPSKKGPFTLRIKVPAGYKIPPHTHPAVEHVTVIEGGLQMGLGDKWNDDEMTNLPVSGFAVMEIGTKHFAGSKDGATIQLHGIGPWDIKYLNPADDPRKKETKD